jgi:hypothetical protein
LVIVVVIVVIVAGRWCKGRRRRSILEILVARHWRGLYSRTCCVERLNSFGSKILIDARPKGRAGRECRQYRCRRTAIVDEQDDLQVESAPSSEEGPALP